MGKFGTEGATEYQPTEILFNKNCEKVNCFWKKIFTFMHTQYIIGLALT